MDVDFSYYIEHYFEPDYCLKFFGLALGLLFVTFVAMYIYTQIKAGGRRGQVRHEYIRIEWHVLTQRYYEMIFSGTSILFFMATYYIINRFITIDPYRSVWDKYSDFFLMLLIVMSCVFNSFLDRVFVRLKFLTRDEKSAGRLTGMVYMILIFLYIKFIYQDDNYDMFITYFLGLMVGRFAYFDSTVHDFVKAMSGVRKNLGLLLVVLTYTAIMCFVGFKTDYLLTHNGVITNIFFTHLYMCVAIFVLHNIHIAELVTGRGDRTPKLPAEEDYYEEDDYREYDNEEEYESSEAYSGRDYSDDAYVDPEGYEGYDPYQNSDRVGDDFEEDDDIELIKI